jgi:hypothetical protein
VFLCGAQAVGVAYAQQPEFEVEMFDYKRKTGVAMTEIRGIEKIMYNNYQHGVVTAYVSSVADS